MSQIIKNRIEEIKSGRVPEGYKQTPFGIFPCDWEIKKLSEVCDIYSDGTPSTSKSEYWDGEIPWCSPTDITKSKKYITTTERYITKQGLENSSAILMPSNSILMCSRATIGPRCINKVPMATNQGFKNLICKNSIDTEYIYYLLDKLVLGFLKSSNGSTFLELSKSELEKAKYCLPKNDNERIKIAEILMKWDEMVELQEQYIKKLEIRKKCLFTKLLNTNFKKLVSLQDLIDNDYVRLIKPKELPIFEDERLYLSTSSIVQNEIIDNEGYISYTNRPSRAQMYPIANSVWFAKMEKSIKVYKFNQHQQDKYVLSTGYYGFLCDENEVSSDFLMQVFLSPEFNRMKDLYSEGSSQNGIKDNNLSDILLSLPSINEQKRIASILLSADEEISLQKEKLDKIKTQRKILQQYLLTGIVRVK